MYLEVFVFNSTALFDASDDETGMALTKGVIIIQIAEVNQIAEVMVIAVILLKIAEVLIIAVIRVKIAEMKVKVAKG